MNDNKLHQEAHIVASMEAMPDGQEEQRCTMTYVTIAQEFEPLKNVFGNPMVRVHIKRFNVVLEFLCILEDDKFNISAAWPICDAISSYASKC